MITGDKLQLVFVGVGTCVSDVVQGGIGVQTVTDGDGIDTLWAESPLRVDVRHLSSLQKKRREERRMNREHLSVTSSKRARKLGGDAEGVADLSLSRAKFTEELRDGHGLDTSTCSR